MISTSRKKWGKLLFGFVILIASFGISNPVMAAKDTQSPKMSVTPDTKEPTNKDIGITVRGRDSSGIYVMKYASGSKDLEYFKSKGKVLVLNSTEATLKLKRNGTYTFYTRDKAGNGSIKKITISNIDKALPVLEITKSNDKITNGNVVLSMHIEKTGSEIESLTYLLGEKTEEDFLNAGKTIQLKQLSGDSKKKIYEYSGRLTVKTNYTITFLATDKAGNKTLQFIKIDNIDKKSPSLTYKLNTTTPTKDPITITVTGTDGESGVSNVSYLAGKKSVEDFNTSTATQIKLNAKNSGQFKVDKNGSYTILISDKAGNQVALVVTISNIDTTSPVVTLDYNIMNQAATIDFTVSDKSGVKNVTYLKGKNTSITSDKWTNGKDISSASDFKVTSAGNYSVLVEDMAGNKTIEVINVVLEMKAVWISYLEFASFGKDGYSKAQFQKFIDTMFDNVVSLHMNTVIVQVRPFADAMYKSSYFPWSKYAAGTQGKSPGYDPLAYMVEAAHERGLEIHAWLNPYRVTTGSTDVSKLAADNPARVWMEDDNTSNDRNVLSFGGNLYFNPAIKEVRTLITNGVKEIVNNYDIDGIHFDDYFYPSLGSKYASNFDATEYKAYATATKDAGKTPMNIGNWRRNNVNTLVKGIYSAVKKIDADVEFGISPGGFIDSLSSDLGYYVDIDTWLSNDGYVDYICPQIYWTFSNSSYPFDKTLQKWLKARSSSTVKVYVGIANYRAGSTLEADWKNDVDVLRNQVTYARDTGLVDGFMFFRYDFFYNKVTKPGVDRLLEILK
ncbi:MAG: glycoside hydrolase family 10 protein [Anaerocolumna sp.]